MDLSNGFISSPLQNLGLAVRAFKTLQEEYAEHPGVSQSVLVLAGGYDNRLAENREHFCELEELIEEVGLQEQVCTEKKAPLYACMLLPLSLSQACHKNSAEVQHQRMSPVLALR